MIDNTAVRVSPKKFKKIRELNRRRNYFTKRVRNALRVYIAKTLWIALRVMSRICHRQNSAADAQ